VSEFCDATQFLVNKVLWLCVCFYTVKMYYFLPQGSKCSSIRLVQRSIGPAEEAFLAYSAQRGQGGREGKKESGRQIEYWTPIANVACNISSRIASAIKVLFPIYFIQGSFPKKLWER